MKSVLAAVSTSFLIVASASAARCPDLTNTYIDCVRKTEENVLSKKLEVVTIEKNAKKSEGYSISLRFAGEPTKNWASVKDNLLSVGPDENGEIASTRIQCSDKGQKYIWIGTKYPEDAIYEGEQQYHAKWTIRPSPSNSSDLEIKSVAEFEDVYVCSPARSIP